MTDTAVQNVYNWKTDAITTEVVRHALETIAEEMGTSLRRTALSVVIKDMKDYACAVFAADGSLLAAALDIPTLLASMEPALRACIDKWGDEIFAGDVLITNHPYMGCAHTNDIQIFVPTFVGETLVGFTGTIAHHADWGGAVPGTVNTQSLSVFEEGLMLPALKLEHAGVRDRNIYDLIGANTRFPKQNYGDLRGQVASAQAGSRQLQGLGERYGAERLADAFDDLIGYTDQRTRAEIVALPDGVYKNEGWLDDNGVEPGKPVRYAVEVTVKGDTMKFDFTGTAEQMHSGMNLPWATTLSVVHYSVKCILPEDVPFNAGSQIAVEVYAPEGTVTNPRFPAAVGQRHVSSQRLASVVTDALVPIAPARISAEWAVGWPVMFGETHSPKTGDGVALLLNVMGGAGAFDGRDGGHAVDTHMSNCALVPAEIVESGYMLRVEQYSLIEGSGGVGRWVGGKGMRGDYRNIAEEPMYYRTEVEQTIEKFAPKGLNGGGSGATSSATLIHVDGSEEVLPTKGNGFLEPGGIISLRAGGGGGFGAPEGVKAPAAND